MLEHVKHEKKKWWGRGGTYSGLTLLYKYEKFHVSSSKIFSKKLETIFRPNLYHIKFLSIVLIRVDF